MVIEDEVGADVKDLPVFSMIASYKRTQDVTVESGVYIRGIGSRGNGRRQIVDCPALSYWMEMITHVRLT